MPPSFPLTPSLRAVRRRLAGTAGLLAVLIAGLPAPVAAQSAPAKPESPSPVARPAAARDADAVTTLNPFEVKSDSDSSYGALNSNSITRFNTELARTPISADIFTETFINDIGARTIEDMVMSYVAGAGFDSENNTTGDRNAGSNIKLRGLSTPTLQRDGFMPNSGIGTGVSSTFDVERVEVINGPQSLLYGNGGAGGVINTVSKQARLNHRAFGSLTLRSDEYGNAMGQLDYGLGQKNVAARVAVTHERIGGRRDNVYGDLDAAYAQFAYRVGRTVLRLSAEHAHFDRLISGAATTYTAPAAAASSAMEKSTGRRSTPTRATSNPKRPSGTSSPSWPKAPGTTGCPASLPSVTAASAAACAPAPASRCSRPTTPRIPPAIGR